MTLGLGYIGTVREFPAVLRRQAALFDGNGNNPHNQVIWEQHGRKEQEQELWLLAASLLREAAEKLEAKIMANRPHRERIVKAPFKLQRERLAKPIVRERLNIERGTRK